MPRWKLHSGSKFIQGKSQVVLTKQYSVWVDFLLKTNETLEIYIPNIILGTEKNTKEASIWYDL